ncbi:MAG: DNA-directed DNA polymerase II small subunit [Methanomassiliicoccales archaeon]|jgi:DNA polymerase II small subunit|nr:DNA-directed DNA polymerase II small subunit [Methanomassiliicoccales archaeon]
MRERVLEFLASNGILLEPSALEIVMSKDDPIAFVQSVISFMKQHPLIVTAADLEEYMRYQSAAETPASMNVLPSNEGFRTNMNQRGGVRKIGEVKILKDITGNSTCEGNISDFARYFLDRFNAIKRMLAHRRELAGSLPISRALKLERDVRVIAMVNEVRTTKTGHKILEIEDEEERCLALIPKDSPLINDSVVPDEVIGIVGKSNRKGEMLIVQEIIRPDVPLKSRFERNGATSMIAFASDIHVGSKTFLRKQWDAMVNWLRTEGVSSGVSYLIVPGDCVDGIGVFPDQEEELVIDDIFKQYEMLSELLKEIPDGVTIVLQPGNHDAVRLAEPQPAFHKEIADLFDSQVVMIGNPCYLEIEGRTILSYHGRSIDDLIGNIQSLTYANPIDAMKEMLKRRHLAPIYGGKTPIAPEKKDFLVIDPVPDIFVTGHVHGAGVSDYRGVRIINASTWQAQTSYQRMHNFNPDPAKLPVVHLGTGKCTVMNFN